MMNKFVWALVIGVSLVSCVDHFIINPTNAMAISDGEINKILKAKEIVRSMVNYPDTLVFHDLHTKVSGNTVILKFTCKNAFGVPQTHTLEIKVN